MAKNIEALEAVYRQLEKSDPNMDLVEDMLRSAAAVSRKLKGPEEVPANAPVKRGVRKLISNIVDPKRETAIPRSVEALPLRLKAIPFEIAIPEVSEEVYAETHRAVEAAIPGVFIVPIISVSIEDLLTEDLNRGQRRFNHSWVNSSKVMRATIPPEMEVFIDPKAVRIEGSNSLPTDEQKARIAEAAGRLRAKLPEGVRSLVDLHMVDPSTYSQLEDRYMDQNNGALLFPNFFARTDVETVPGLVAYAGRVDPADRRYVDGWLRDRGIGFVFAVPVGVLPRKLKS